MNALRDSKVYIRHNILRARRTRLWYLLSAVVDTLLQEAQ